MSLDSTKYTIILIGRQSYLEDGHMRLNPAINVLTSAVATAPVEAYELFLHLEEIANLLNTEIEDDMQSESEEPTDFAKFFSFEESPFFAGLPISPEGYSNLSVYIKIEKGENYTICVPDDFNHLINFAHGLKHVDNSGK